MSLDRRSLDKASESGQVHPESESCPQQDVASCRRGLNDIAADTEFIITRAAEGNDENLGRVSETSRWILNEIDSLSLKLLPSIWDDVDSYRKLIRDVRLAISFNIMTSEHADSFCQCMDSFVNNLRTIRTAVHPSPTLGDQGGTDTGIPEERINRNNRQETNIRRNQIEIKITGIRWRTSF